MGSRPIIVVTGGNGGVGYGVCQRLLFQLSHPRPSDVAPQFTDVLDPEVVAAADVRLPPCEELTLVLACRSLKKAEAAREQLYDALDKELARRRRKYGSDAHADAFRENLRIELVHIDMGTMSTVFAAARELTERFPYISHLVFNAGVCDYNQINYWWALKAFLRSPMIAVTISCFSYSTRGVKSKDGLGWIWQCNVFSHYTLYRQLQPLLAAYRAVTRSPARVLWMTSLEAIPTDYDSDDMQLVHTYEGYALSKYQIDIVASRLDFTVQRDPDAGGGSRHFLVHPGICATNISAAMLNSFTTVVKEVVFWIIRWCGSPHHAIDPYTAASSTVHLALVSLALIPAYLTAFAEHPRRFARSALIIPAHLKKSAAPLAAVEVPSKPISSSDKGPDGPIPVRFGAETDRLGRERVGMTEVKQWREHAEDSARLVEQYEELYQEFLKRETQDSVEMTRNGHAN